MRHVPILALCLLAVLACLFICLSDTMTPAHTEYGGSRAVAEMLDEGQ